MGIRFQPARTQRKGRFTLLWILLLAVLPLSSLPTGTAAQGAILLTVDGSTGPVTVPVNTNLPIVATGLTPLGVFTYAAYEGGDCGLGLAAVQDLEANAEGVWDWSSLSLSTPTTLWIRVTDGPNNSNCVQITWEVADPTEIPLTEVPLTEVPLTEVPLTEVPLTEVPLTEVPLTEVPLTEVPLTEVPLTEVPTEVPLTETPTGTATETPTGIATTTPDPSSTATATGTATSAPTHPPTATAPVSGLPTTGNEGGQSPSIMGFALLIAGSLLLLGAASVTRRRGTTSR